MRGPPRQRLTLVVPAGMDIASCSDCASRRARRQKHAVCEQSNPLRTTITPEHGCTREIYERMNGSASTCAVRYHALFHSVAVSSPQPHPISHPIELNTL